ncbi:hypothetical protein CEP53_005558 [Fusarium sp. AF-6]|nr:hypothetical protein CEP53_005558 [Fusarium sp. AF-6]
MGQVSLRPSGLVHGSRSSHVHGSPLSPVIVDQFRSHSAHTHLIHEKAMLCYTILTISSRFFMLPGAGGTSRSHYIHQRLWSHCEMLIKRILLGQEKTSTSKTRVIGTVESLMLISDWHPRALHFPPETDGWDALPISPGYDPMNRRRMNNEAPLIRWKEDVFEPAKRANRMSWMLLGMANNLAYELGVISSQRPEASKSAELQVMRSLRAQKLLYVYITQTATRLGYPSVFPESIAVTASRLPMQNSDEPAHRSWMAYMELSLELTQLSRTASSMFFQSAAHLQSQVLGDHYADLLEHFAASLSKWQQKYDAVCKGRSGSHPIVFASKDQRHQLDWVILPMLWVMYWFNYLDRNAITVARLDNLEEELNLSSTEYQTCVSILFAGYILGQIPSNMLMTRLRPSLFMSGAMALWAVVSTLTAIAKDFKGLLLTRFFLGITEAPFYPGALYMLSIFYTRKEIATRISILFTANICGTAFAGLIAIGVFQMSGVARLSGWRWLFILQGIITFVLSVASAWILPDEPINTRWLSEQERELAHSRVAADTVQIRTNTTTWAGLTDTCRDPRLWVLILMQHFHMAASNFKNFFPTIVGTLGFGRNATLALTCPPYIISGIVCIAWAANSGRMNERTWHITVAKVIAVFGFVLACTTMNVGTRYFATCAFASGVYACNSAILGWVSSTCGQTKEKKATSLAIVNTIASLSPIYTPYLWPKSDEPRYTIAMSSSAAFSAASALLAWLMRWMLIRENRKIRRENNEERLFYAY